MRSRPWSLAVLATALVALAAGCKPAAAPVPAAGTPAPAVADGTPATEADCREFAAKVETAVRDKDRATLGQLFALTTLMERSIADLTLSGTNKESVLKGLKTAAARNSFVDQIMAEIEKGGSYKLLRVHEVDGRTRALLRLLTTESGVNYHDILLTRYPDGRVSLEDVYVFAAGEMLTQSVRRLLLPAAAELDRGLVARLRGTDQLYYSNLPKIQGMVRAVQAGNGREAVATYKALPAGLRQNKVILLFYLRAAAEVDDAEYTAALETFRQQYPADPAIDFISIDYFLLRKQYDESLRCIGAVAKAVGGDPYLHALRANVLVEAGRFPDARAAAEKAVAEEPSLPEAYWSRVSVALREKDHKDTLAWLKKVVEKTGAEIEDLAELDDYKEFVRAPEHAAWVKWYADRKKQ